MVRKLLLILGVLLSLTFVSAQPEFFEFYDDNVFTAKKIFSPFLKPVQKSTLIFSSPVVEPIIVEQEEVKETVEVIIGKKKFDPEKTTIKAGQSITWKNEREGLQALLFGMREIHEMKSGFMDPGASFTWTFATSGRYKYVDAIVIGMSGEIVVEE